MSALAETIVGVEGPVGRFRRNGQDPNAGVVEIGAHGVVGIRDREVEVARHCHSGLPHGQG